MGDRDVTMDTRGEAMVCYGRDDGALQTPGMGDRDITMDTRGEAMVCYGREDGALQTREWVTET